MDKNLEQTMNHQKHWADKPILRDLFWFLVLPFQFKQYVQQLNKEKQHEQEDQS